MGTCVWKQCTILARRPSKYINPLHSFWWALESLLRLYHRMHFASQSVGFRCRLVDWLAMGLLDFSVGPPESQWFGGVEGWMRGDQVLKTLRCMWVCYESQMRCHNHIISIHTTHLWCAHISCGALAISGLYTWHLPQEFANFRRNAVGDFTFAMVHLPTFWIVIMEQNDFKYFYTLRRTHITTTQTKTAQRAQTNTIQTKSRAKIWKETCLYCNSSIFLCCAWHICFYMLFLFLCRSRCCALNLPQQPSSQMHYILALCRPCTGFLPQTARAETRRCRCRWKKTKQKGQSQTSTATTASSPSTTVITNSATTRAAIATRGEITLQASPWDCISFNALQMFRGEKRARKGYDVQRKDKKWENKNVLLPKCKLLPKTCKRSSFSSKLLLVQCR